MIAYNDFVKLRNRLTFFRDNKAFPPMSPANRVGYELGLNVAIEGVEKAYTGEDEEESEE